MLCRLGDVAEGLERSDFGEGLEGSDFGEGREGRGKTGRIAVLSSKSMNMLSGKTHTLEYSRTNRLNREGLLHDYDQKISDESTFLFLVVQKEASSSN